MSIIIDILAVIGLLTVLLVLLAAALMIGREVWQRDQIRQQRNAEAEWRVNRT